MRKLRAKEAIGLVHRPRKSVPELWVSRLLILALSSPTAALFSQFQSFSKLSWKTSGRVGNGPVWALRWVIEFAAQPGPYWLNDLEQVMSPIGAWGSQPWRAVLG